MSIQLKLLNLFVAVVSRGENNKKQQKGAENQAHSSPIQALYFTNCSDTKRKNTKFNTVERFQWQTIVEHKTVGDSISENPVFLLVRMDAEG